MDKSAYIRQNLDGLFRLWLYRVTAFGALIFMVLSGMDYFAVPDNFRNFLVVRMAVSSFLVAAALLTFKARKRYLLYLLGYAAILASAIAIEFMILGSGGHRSQYYTQMILLYVCMAAFLPASLTFHIPAAGLIYSVYLLPILIADEVTGFHTFFIANSFIVTFIVTGLLLRYLSQGSILNELGLRFDLEQKKAVLEEYSSQLEELVDIRTMALRKSEKMYKTLFEGATDGIVITNSKGVIVDVNEQVLTILGSEKKDWLGRNIAAIGSESGAAWEGRMRRLLDGELIIFETEYRGADGRRLHLETSAKAIEIKGIVLIQSFLRDITERKRAEEEARNIHEQLLQSQKMESIGKLAGGIAHDFNNILTAIQGYVGLCMMKAEQPDSLRANLEQIEYATMNAANLTQQLLMFSSKQPVEVEQLNLNSRIDDLIMMLQRLIGEDISIVKNQATGLWRIMADVGNMEQVIMNLAVNARDAMPEGGELRITTENVSLDKEQSRQIPKGRPGDFVCLSVADMGVGMDAETVKHIFEPFFTTKGPGKGTGLGLSVVYGIVNKHGGWVNITSEAGKGSTFRVYFPRAVAEPEIKKDEKAPFHDYRGQGERILLVEDEREVRNFLNTALTESGYFVFTAADAQEAIRIYERERGDFHLAFSDIILPGQNGLQLVEQLRSRKPGLKVLLSSGYLDKDSQWQALRESGYPFIGKPYTLPNLLKAVKTALTAPSPAGDASRP